MNAVIISGGKGKRLEPLTLHTPKPMIPIGGTPLLELQLEVLYRYGITRAYILTGHFSEIIEDYFREGHTHGVNVTCLCEERPLGTAGAVRTLKHTINEDFLLVYGDVLFDMKLDDLIRFHRERKASSTLVVHPTDHPYDSDLVAVDSDSLITGIAPKPHGEGYYQNLGNAGIYALSPKVFDYIPDGAPSDFMRDVFPAMLRNSEKLCSYRTSEYLKDMGTPDRLELVRRDFLSGKARRLSKEFKRSALFLDRDGTLIRDVDLLSKPEDLVLFDFSASAVRKVNQSELLSILITNQPVVARNLCDLTTLKKIHDKLETQLGKEGAYLDGIFFCPHHPDSGYSGENPALKIECGCRKPKTGMVDKAVQTYNIDKASSWFIGDSTSDIQTGFNAGMRTVLLRTGRGGRDGKYLAKPDYVFDTLGEAVDFIFKSKPILDEASKEIIHTIVSGATLSVIAVGGAARSGKSTFVTCLCEAVRSTGKEATVVSLDNWLAGVTERSDSMTVRERYDYSAIERDISRLVYGETIHVRNYDSYTRILSEGAFLSCKNYDILIIEGVTALDIEGVSKAADVRVYCETSESERWRRFYSFYRWKGLPKDEIEQLYDTRMTDEIPYILDSRKYADYIINDTGIRKTTPL